MIDFEEQQLPNGLTVICHHDPNVPTAAVNLLYDVGSRDESLDKTGFAHLFEHLMFGGSANVASFDEPLQQAGGESNAFTSADITNYYDVLPAVNIETAFWLESDRMSALSFAPKTLQVQQNVVIEEYKQRYLNQPYGDAWHLIRPVAYQQHPYRWPTIGAEISHIEQATLEDVKAFFYRHYRPDNAILSVAGGVSAERCFELAAHWFGDIRPGGKPPRQLAQEPEQTERRLIEAKADVPQKMLYLCYKMCGKNEPDYIPTDMLSDLLGHGKSARLHEALVKQQPLFTGISVYVTGSEDPGLLVISGRLLPGVSFEQAEAAIRQQLDLLLEEGLAEEELQKIKNQYETALVFSEIEVLHRAMRLAFARLRGNTHWINEEINHIRAVTKEEVMRVARQVLREDRCTVLRYDTLGQ